MRHFDKLVWLLLMIGCSRELPHRESPPERDASSDASMAPPPSIEHSEVPDAGSAAVDAGTSVSAHDMDAGAPRSAPDAAAADSGTRIEPVTTLDASPAAAGSAAAGQPAAVGGAPSSAEKQGIEASNEVFRDDVLRTYELTFTDEDWAELQRTATEEVYVPVSLSVDGTPIGKVGVRYKGAYGTLRNCFKDGVQTCRKLSMKVKLDEYDPELRYHGLKKLNFHSSLRDGSHLHERLGYKLFRDFGVLAPRSAHARININGVYKGLYNLTEDVDGRFTDYRFEGKDGEGTLYKEAWPAFSQDPGYFSDAQETNEGSSPTKIVKFAEELASATDLGAVVTHWMDPDATLRYLAVHNAIDHWDGPLTFYCHDAYGCSNHNYFLYESVSLDRVALVAWDLDNIFYEDPITEQAHVPAWYERVADCDARWHADETGDEFLAPGCDRLVQGFVALGLDKYRATLDALLQGPYRVAPLQADIDRWAAQIDESVKTDPAGSGYEDWRGNVSYLKTMVGKRYTAVEAIRDGL